MISGSTVLPEAAGVGVEAGAGAGVAAGGVACWASTGGLNRVNAIAEVLASEARRRERDIMRLILTPRATHTEQPRIERNPAIRANGRDGGFRSGEEEGRVSETRRRGGVAHPWRTRRQNRL